MSERTQAYGAVLIAYGVVFYIPSAIFRFQIGTILGACFVAAGAFMLAYERHQRDKPRKL